MSYKGKYVIKNVSKYKGDANNVFYKSLIELRFMKFCDFNPNILQWCYEGLVIPYVCQTDNRKHKYYPDFFVVSRSADGKGVNQFLIEIKCTAETHEPNPPKAKSQTKRYARQMATWTKNKSKWEQAQLFCEKNGFGWRIITETDLKNYSKLI